MRIEVARYALVDFLLQLNQYGLDKVILTKEDNQFIVILGSEDEITPAHPKTSVGEIKHHG